MLLPVYSYIYLMFVYLVYPPHLGMVDTGVNMACICVYMPLNMILTIIHLISSHSFVKYNNVIKTEWT